MCLLYSIADAIHGAVTRIKCWLLMFLKTTDAFMFIHVVWYHGGGGDGGGVKDVKAA